jgi:hypothetical protein
MKIEKQTKAFDVLLCFLLSVEYVTLFILVFSKPVHYQCVLEI